MVQTINSNIVSLNARRNLAGINHHLSTSYRRLSSGYRITTAADDPAGLAISERLRARIRSLKRAQLNAADGISMAQTAEGALHEVSGMLVRMRELAVQSANGAVSGSDKDSMQNELEALREEIDRIANCTEFNGQSLLSGNGSIALQIGAGTETGVDTINLSINDMHATTMGIDAIDIGSTGDSFAAMDALDGAIDFVTSARGDLGAFLNRMGHAMNNLGVEISNMTEAESRIRDVDVAEETARLTKYSIMQSMAIQMVARANMEPSRMLALLQ